MSSIDDTKTGFDRRGEVPSTGVLQRKRVTVWLPTSTRGRFGVAVALVVALACILAVATLISARSLMLSGAGEIATARTELAGIKTTPSDHVLSTVGTHLRTSRDDFDAARTRLNVLSPVLHRLWWVPGVGDQLAAAPELATLASNTARGLVSLVDGAAPAVHEMRQAPHASHFSMLAHALERNRRQFVDAYALFSEAQREFAISLRSHPAAAASQLRELKDVLPGLGTASLALSLVPSLLGETRPRTYLVAYQDPQELRATGGFIGSIGIIHVNRGRIRQHFESTEIGNREKLLVSAPEPVRTYNEIWLLLRDSNWSPNFPTTADLERYFLKMDLDQKAAGVINLTPAAVADILAATGPLAVPEYGRVVNAQNLSRLVDYYAHWAPVTVNPAGASADTRRKLFIAVVGQHLIERLQGLSVNGWVRVSQELSKAAERGDLLLNFANPREEELARLAGADGAIDSTRSDYLYLVNSNIAYNRLNPWVHIWTRYNVTIRSDRWLDARLSVTLWNQPAPAREATRGWGPGGGTYGNRTDYADFMRVYVPAGAELVDQSGWTQPWSPGPAYGKTEFSGYLIVKRGERVTVHLHYVVPPNVFTPTGGKRYHLVFQHQPGSHPDSLDVTVRDAAGESRSWHLHHPQRTRSLSMPITPRPFAPIPLPAEPMPTVAPGQWIEPHMFFDGPKLNDWR